MHTTNTLQVKSILEREDCRCKDPEAAACSECLAKAGLGSTGLDALRHPFQPGDLVNVIWIGMCSGLRRGHLRSSQLGGPGFVGGELWFC